MSPIWRRVHGCLVSDVVLGVADFDALVASPAHQPLCEWVRFHGGDPDLVPIDATITRDLDRCRVVLPVFVLDDEGNRIVDRDADGIPVKFKLTTAVLQGEAPPLPWPDILLEELTR